MTTTNASRKVSPGKKLQNFLLNVRYAFRPHKPLLTLRLFKTLTGVYLLMNVRFAMWMWPFITAVI